MPPVKGYRNEDQDNRKPKDLEEQPTSRSAGLDRLIVADTHEKRSAGYEHLIEHKGKISLSERLDHVTWANFTLTMSTGGIALLLGSQPHTFHGLEAIAKVVFIFDLVLFSILSTLIARRFVKDPGTLGKSLTHPTESLMFPTFLLSLASIIACMQKFGNESTGPWLIVAVRICFWIYVALSFMVAVAQFHILFSGHQLTIQSMTPAWLMPIFPCMLCGTVAATISTTQPFDQRMPIFVAGLTFQGLGFWVALLVYSIYLGRLMENGPPTPDLRPGMFIAVGPPSFTALALVQMSQSLPEGYGFFASHPNAVEVLQVLAVAFAVMLWALAFWFFCITVSSILADVPHMSFHLTWWSFVFPNTGFTISTITIGRQLESAAIEWIGTAMTLILVTVYFAVLGAEIRAVVRGDIWYPGKDEDGIK